LPDRASLFHSGMAVDQHFDSLLGSSLMTPSVETDEMVDELRLGQTELDANFLRRPFALEQQKEEGRLQIGGQTAFLADGYLAPVAFPAFGGNLQQVGNAQVAALAYALEELQRQGRPFRLRFTVVSWTPRRAAISCRSGVGRVARFSATREFRNIALQMSSPPVSTNR